jgi:outer membrane murein-binding lipoprotein Lpp
MRELICIVAIAFAAHIISACVNTAQYEHQRAQYLESRIEQVQSAEKFRRVKHAATKTTPDESTVIVRRPRE